MSVVQIKDVLEYPNSRNWWKDEVICVTVLANYKFTHFEKKCMMVHDDRQKGQKENIMQLQEISTQNTIKLFVQEVYVKV